MIYIILIAVVLDVLNSVFVFIKDMVFVIMFLEKVG